MSTASLSSKIRAENANRCEQCGHTLQEHKLSVWKKQPKNVKGKAKTRNKQRDVPWICIGTNKNGQECACTEYFLVRVPSYR